MLQTLSKKIIYLNRPCKPWVKQNEDKIKKKLEQHDIRACGVLKLNVLKKIILFLLFLNLKWEVKCQVNLPREKQNV